MDLTVWSNEVLIPNLDMVKDMVLTQRLCREIAIQLVVSMVNLEVISNFAERQEDVMFLEELQEHYVNILLKD